MVFDRLAVRVRVCSLFSSEMEDVGQREMFPLVLLYSNEQKPVSKYKMLQAFLIDPCGCCTATEIGFSLDLVRDFHGEE